MRYYSDGGNFVRKEKKNIKKIKYRWMKYYKNNGIFGPEGINKTSRKINTVGWSIKSITVFFDGKMNIKRKLIRIVFSCYLVTTLYKTPHKTFDAEQSISALFA